MLMDEFFSKARELVESVKLRMGLSLLRRLILSASGILCAPWRVER